MKNLFVLFVSVTALFLSGCNEQPLISDEEYNRIKGPAAYSPDPTAHLPVQQNQSGRSY